MNKSTLTEQQYRENLDELMRAIEDAIDQVIDETGLEIDYETSAGILTLTCEDNTTGVDSKVILSRQTPLLQLWLAARNGGFHFDFHPDQQEWLLDSDSNGFGKGESFIKVLNRCLSEQTGESVELVL
ncbi:MAG: iron donor protein CyaY [Endozoicomonas sp.]